MARMMPPYCPITAPPGEKELFRALSSGNNTDDWVVLHSLGIANHVRQVEGEADFVVIVPHKGVLVIEVKSHMSVERLSDGTWKLGENQPIERGPFQQVDEAKYSIWNFLKKKGIDLRFVPIMSAVWFTHFKARSTLSSAMEWHDWQVLDLDDLERGAVLSILRTIELGTRHLSNAVPSFSNGKIGPDQDTAKRIVWSLRPQFELAKTPGDARRARKTQLITFIEEQYRALDYMADNHAVLFSGPAGSGKTLLAMEAAQRELAKGRTGALLCFNRFLGRRLADDLNLVDSLTVGSLSRVMLRIANVNVPTNPSGAFWDKVLPDLAAEKLLNGDVSPYEFLIVDEVQDIARESFLDVLDLMVIGGLKGGRLLLFGDFERQAVFGRESGRELLRQKSPHLASMKLTKNCRNLPRIGHQVNFLSKLKPGYEKFRRQDDGVNPNIIQYKAGEDQTQLLVNAIQKLRQDGFELGEIVVLSPRGLDSTAETTTNPWLRQILKKVDGTQAKPGQLQYSTIQAFKGLEAAAVVVTDLDRHTVPDFESLLYVGLTRATDRLTALFESITIRELLKERNERF